MKHSNTAHIDTFQYRSSKFYLNFVFYLLIQCVGKYVILELNKSFNYLKTRHIIFKIDSFSRQQTIGPHWLNFFLYPYNVLNFLPLIYLQVCQLARVGGKDVKDCTHKVMDRYLFTH